MQKDVDPHKKWDFMLAWNESTGISIGRPKKNS
jgi:hypothetical protein